MFQNMKTMLIIMIISYRDLIDDLIDGLAEAVSSSNESIVLYFFPLCSVFATNLALMKEQMLTS